MLNIKPLSFILLKMVHAFALSSVMRGCHKYKDVWSALIDGTELHVEREPGNPSDT